MNHYLDQRVFDYYYSNYYYFITVILFIRKYIHPRPQSQHMDDIKLLVHVALPTGTAHLKYTYDDDDDVFAFPFNVS
jgi:hypothetical protein